MTKSDTELIKFMAKKCKNPLYANMILQHLAGTIQDFEAICETIGKVQHCKAPGDSPCADGRREKEVHLVSAESARGILVVSVGTARKRQDTSAKIVLNAKPSKVDLDLDLDL